MAEDKPEIKNVEQVEEAGEGKPREGESKNAYKARVK